MFQWRHYYYPKVPQFALKAWFGVDVTLGCDAEVASPFKYGHKSLQPMIFMHGLMAAAKLYTGFCKELASWGMLVLAPDFLDESAGYTVNQNT